MRRPYVIISVILCLLFIGAVGFKISTYRNRPPSTLTTPDSPVTPSLTVSPTDTFSAKTPQPNTTVPSNSTIPTSQPGAVQYINQASTQAKAGNYQAAIDTLNKAISIYPNDQNLQLDKEYYQDQLARSAK